MHFYFFKDLLQCCLGRQHISNLWSYVDIGHGPRERISCSHTYNLQVVRSLYHLLFLLSSQNIFVHQDNFFFITRKKSQKIYQKQHLHFQRQKFHRTQIKVPLMFPKRICSLDTQVSVSTDWEIKMKHQTHLKRLLKKNICWPKIYFSKTLSN